jgi:hypothetical protein
MKRFSQDITGLSPVLNKTPSRAKQTNKQGLEVKQEIPWTLCELKKEVQYNKQHKDKQLLLASYSSGAEKSYLSAVTKKDGSHKDGSTVTHMTVTSVAKGSATGLDAKVQDKAAVHRGTVGLPRADDIMKLGVVGAPGNVTSRSDKVIAGTTTAAHIGQLVRSKVTPHINVDTDTSAQTTILSAC